MLTSPIFRPWRPLWEAQLADELRRADELVERRRKGRQVPPRLSDASEIPRILHALHHAQGRIFSAEFVTKKLEPLLRACVWPRWLLLEAALEQAANSGELGMSALVLRTQIEELDSLRIAATIVSPQGSWDGEAMTEAIRTLMRRVLPRLQAKKQEQLADQASDPIMANTRPELLQLTFDRLSEYVHPNYGSHALMVRPHRIETAQILVQAFVAIYDAFLSLPWAKDEDNRRERMPQRGPTDSRDPFAVLADETIPQLKVLLPLDDSRWRASTECFQFLAEVERDFPASDDQPIDVEAIQALSANSVSKDSWPDGLRTAAGANRYAFLVAQEHRLASEAAALVGGSGQSDERERLPLLLAGLTFAINGTEHQLQSLARHAARFLNAQNVLGATLAVRSMLEHHALAVELAGRVEKLWERAVKAAPAPAPAKVVDALAEAEKQVARVLAGSSDPSGPSSTWRTLWQESVRKPYNVLGPITRLDEKEPGLLQAYGLLSHVTHGTVCTGGDLLGAGGDAWRVGHRPLAAQLAHFLALLCGSRSLLDRQARAMTFAHRLNVLRTAPDQLGERIKEMRLLEGQKLRHGRDVFGSGTASDPYRFRVGLLYHDAYSFYLRQEHIQVRNRTLVQFSIGFGDRVEAEDGRTLYFLNDKLTVQ